MKAVHTFETPGSDYPTTRRNIPEDPVPEFENSFVTNNILKLCVVSSGQCGKGPT
jgi:hypothetical protein